MRISTSLIFNNALRSIQTQQAALVRTQNELASGTKILTPADDPAGAKRLLDLRQSLGLNDQFQTNADAAVTRLTLEESTLSAVTNLLHRARELATQANAATLTDSDRQALGEEVSQRLQELLGIANTKDGNNEFLFAGFSSGTRPFAQVGNNFVYNGDDGQRFLGLGPGFDIAIGDSGTAVFRDISNGNGTFRTTSNAANTGDALIDTGQVADPAAFVADTYTITFLTDTTFQVTNSGAAVVANGGFSSPQAITFNGHEVTLSGTPAQGDSFQVLPAARQDMFTTLNNLAGTMATSTVTSADRAQMHTALGGSLAEIDAALENVLTVRASVGARLNAAENERFIAEDFSLQIESSISAIEDVDIAEAVTRLSHQSASLQAAQRSFALIQNLSLFNFL